QSLKASQSRELKPRSCASAGPTSSSSTARSKPCAPSTASPPRPHSSAFARTSATPSPPDNRVAILLRHATPSLFHQCHLGRMLRSSSRCPGRRPASERGREHQAGRCPPLWPRDLRNDGGSVAAR